jgi:hypothetical protein
MRRWQIVAVAVILTAGTTGAADPPKGFPAFKTQEIDAGLAIGYGVLLEDINGDKKPDIVVVDKHRVVWYENPTWKKRTILDGKTKRDNVCACALDIDGNGDLELALGANWNAGTKESGTLHWLKRGKSLDDEWAMYPIPCDEPTVHRVRAVDLDADGKPEVVVAPLQGRDCTAKGNWTDGRPVRVLAYPVPKDPADPKAWQPEVISDGLYVIHNFAPWPAADSAKVRVLTASYEGVFVHFKAARGWRAVPLGTGDQTNPAGSRGASEVKPGRVGDKQVVATIEPWHGNQVVAYTPTAEAARPWARHVLDKQLRWGHAVWFADLDGDKADELVIGVRDDPSPKAGDKFPDRRGVRVYKCTDGTGAKWDRFLLDPGGVAVEDLAVADLNADGKPDVVAVGRQTMNVRIYWNQGK